MRIQHEQYNDALKRKISTATERYHFAIKCLGPAKRVLDAGCGAGYGAHLLREAGHAVIGVDMAPDAIAYANANYPGDYYVMDIENNNLTDFDAVVCLEVLSQLNNPAKFIYNLDINEIVVSAPIDPNPSDGYFYRKHNLSEEKFKEMLRGWRIINELRQRKYLTIHAKKI
jgi:SAM-dependent methyltransferase